VNALAMTPPGEQAPRLKTAWAGTAAAIIESERTLAGTPTEANAAKVRAARYALAGLSALAIDGAWIPEAARAELFTIATENGRRIAALSGIVARRTGTAPQGIATPPPLSGAGRTQEPLMARPVYAAVLPPTPAPGAQSLFGVLHPLAGRPVTIAEIDSHLAGLGYDQADCPTIRQRLRERGMLHATADGTHTLRTPAARCDGPANIARKGIGV